ncbi:MAG: hypothetical protein ACR2FY_04555 [Pirellulaceae bacterium]
MRFLRFLAAAFCLAAFSCIQPVRCEDEPEKKTPASPAALSKPRWEKGDSWTVETVTQKLQGREADSKGTPNRIRWKFKVGDSEKVATRDCWRIDIECLAKGRLKPATKIWVDKDTLFLRRFQTELPVAGALRTVEETYEPGDGGQSPVLPPINVLPVGLPAFIAGKPKGQFKYTSQPTGQSKDIGVKMRFAHAVTQDVQSPSAKSMEFIPRSLSKSLEKSPAVEVRLAAGQQSVTQLWQAERPWPVYSNDGHTQAWLVVEPAETQGK